MINSFFIAFRELQLEKCNPHPLAEVANLDKMTGCVPILTSYSEMN